MLEMLAPNVDDNYWSQMGLELIGSTAEGANQVIESLAKQMDEGDEGEGEVDDEADEADVEGS